MTVVQGLPAQASEYNTLRGEVNRWFADNNTEAPFGNFNQTYGWGGSAVSSIGSGVLMTAAQMNLLVDRCNIGQDICNNVSGALSQIVIGDGMTAAEFNAIETKSDSITTNRNDIESGELSLYAGGSSIRTTPGTVVGCTFRYTLTDFKTSRYFWNSGGAVNISASISGYSTGAGWDGAGFDEIFSAMGTITMDYTDTVQSGSGGTTYGRGYYDLPAGWSQIFTQDGTGVYSDTTFRIYATQVNYLNTAPAYLELMAVLEPEGGKSVDGTITITTQYRKLDNQSSGGASLTISAPTYSLIDPL